VVIPGAIVYGAANTTVDLSLAGTIVGTWKVKFAQGGTAGTKGDTGTTPTGTGIGQIPERPAANALSADVVSEITLGAGVTVDGVQCKDGIIVNREMNEGRYVTAIFDDLLGSSGGAFNLAGSSSGGYWSPSSVPSNNYDIGYMLASTGNANTINQRGAAYAGSSYAKFNLGGGQHTFAFRAAPALSLFSASLQGMHRAGMVNSVTAEPTAGVYFTSRDGGNWKCDTIVGTSETTTVTDVQCVLNAWHVFKIVVSPLGDEVRFYIDGNLVATHTTNIPGGADSMTYGFSSIRDSITATSVGMLYDWMAMEKIHTTPRW
jgi:hypothetical protein